jgi:ribose transport system ATP-binding protein
VKDALRQGVSLIHQELNLVDDLSVAANFFLGREITWAWPLRLVHQRKMRAQCAERLRDLGLMCSPGRKLSDLTLGQKQLVEIARSLAMHTRILIMDEPTSSLSQSEADKLFQVVAQLKSQRVAIVYISHRLAEVERIADRAVVLRDGRNAGELFGKEINHRRLVELMVGRELTKFFRHQHHVENTGTPRLEVTNLCYVNGPSEPVSFAVQSGEIVGVAGLVGAGRTELSEALFGIRRLSSGQVRIDGNPVRIRKPADSIAVGMLLVPEDRRSHGLFLEDSVQRNIGLPNLNRLNFLRLVARHRERTTAEELRERLRIRTPSVRQSTGLLSGGTQQKVVLGKWLVGKPRVLILDEPTRGIDVGAKSEIYTLMDQLAKEGLAIIMISSDLEEILGMSDRVLVMHQGRIAGELPRETMSEKAIMNLATGGTSSS